MDHLFTDVIIDPVVRLAKKQIDRKGHLCPVIFALSGSVVMI